MRLRTLPAHALLPLLILSSTGTVLAEPQAGPGYRIVAVDGDNDVGEHFALADRGSGNRTGFFYLADEGRLIASSCSSVSCNGASSLTLAGSDRGRHVSAVSRPALSNRPIAAYYDAGTGDLVLLDCSSAECNFGVERILDSSGDVGRDTAITIDPATGFALISYFDADNSRLKLYRCASAACDSGSAVVVDTTSDRGRNSSLVVAGSTLWIAYEDSSSGELILASSSAPFNAFSFFSLAGGAEPSLTADASGFLDMVWRETAGSSLSHLRCLNANCSVANQDTLAGAGRGFRPSAVRTSGDRLLVSHFEPATGTLHASHCPDPACVSPQALVLDSGAGLTGKSAAGSTSTGLATVLYHDATRDDVRAAQCTTAPCTTILRRTALNGLPVGRVQTAVLPDGRPLLAYIRQRQPWLALCSDPDCNALARRVLPGFNSDTRPALAVRPDGRPLVYYSSVGGSELFNCAVADCSSGAAVPVSGSGNFTSDVIEMAIRADGRAVLLYTVSNLNDAYAYVCDDVECSSGNSRLLVDEPTTDSTFVSGFSIAIGADNRPIVMYAKTSTASSEHRLARCADTECMGAAAITVGQPGSFFGYPLALRSDARPAFIEYTGASIGLGLCDDVGCSSRVSFPLPIAGIARSLLLRPGNLPVFDTGTNASSSVTFCDDPICDSFQTRTVITDSAPTSSYQGSLAAGLQSRMYLGAEEQTLADVMLAVPLTIELFADGFE